MLWRRCPLLPQQERGDGGVGVRTAVVGRVRVELVGAGEAVVGVVVVPGADGGVQAGEGGGRPGGGGCYLGGAGMRFIIADAFCWSVAGAEGLPVASGDGGVVECASHYSAGVVVYARHAARARHASRVDAGGDGGVVDVVSRYSAGVAAHVHHTSRVGAGDDGGGGVIVSRYSADVVLVARAHHASRVGGGGDGGAGIVSRYSTDGADVARARHASRVGAGGDGGDVIASRYSAYKVITFHFYSADAAFHPVSEQTASHDAAGVVFSRHFPLHRQILHRGGLAVCVDVPEEALIARALPVDDQPGHCVPVAIEGAGIRLVVSSYRRPVAFRVGVAECGQGDVCFEAAVQGAAFVGGGVVHGVGKGLQASGIVYYVGFLAVGIGFDFVGLLIPFLIVAGLGACIRQFLYGYFVRRQGVVHHEAEGEAQVLVGVVGEGGAGGVDAVAGIGVAAGKLAARGAVYGEVCQILGHSLRLAAVGVADGE